MYILLQGQKQYFSITICLLLWMKSAFYFSEKKRWFSRFTLDLNKKSNNVLGGKIKLMYENSLCFELCFSASQQQLTPAP